MKYIYKITNIINNKIYIGKTIKDIKERFEEHKREALRYKKCSEEGTDFGYNSKIYPAMIEYGFESFEISLVEVFDDSVDLEQKEQEYILKYNATADTVGYNISPGGLGGPLFKGHNHTEKTKKLLSDQRKGIKQDPVFVEKRVVKHRRVYQNLNTGEIFIGAAAAKTKYDANIYYAVKHKGKSAGHFWIQLPDGDLTGLDEGARLKLIEQREEEAHKIHSEAGRKGMLHRSEETKQAMIEKVRLTTKKMWAERTDAEKAEISIKISKAQIGKKPSKETIQKLKDYYKNASPEELLMRNLHNSMGQKGKKRYENPITGKHKMFIPGEQPAGWIPLPHRGGGVKGRKKFTNKVTGEHKMFLPNEVDENIWERYNGRRNKKN